MGEGFSTNKNRYSKAKKVESILKEYLNKNISELKILDIGCGYGSIGSYFAKNNKVYCVDTQDRRERKNTHFYEVNSAKLPFKDKTFDIIISNHVVEHIKEQDLHLDEIKRCLKDNGCCYFATPNLIFPVEPHYKIPLIHYFPNYTFFKILKLFNIYQEDIYLLSYFQMLNKIKMFKVDEFTHKVIKNPAKYYSRAFSLNKISINIIKKLNFLSPTNIFILSKK